MLVAQGKGRRVCGDVIISELMDSEQHHSLYDLATVAHIIMGESLLMAMLDNFFDARDSSDFMTRSESERHSVGIGDCSITVSKLLLAQTTINNLRLPRPWARELLLSPAELFVTWISLVDTSIAVGDTHTISTQAGPYSTSCRWRQQTEQCGIQGLVTTVMAWPLM